jgi:cytochrome bd ubiquinol oxidase subunit II
VTLNDLWYVLFVLIIAGYLILDGFDMGVGILHLPLARDDVERRTFLNSIGPVWDGNEVWLVIAGGVLFGVFPLVYASIFSGFYLAFMLVLLVMILRTVAIEFRSKEKSPRWRSAWDTVFAAASVGLALLLGVAFGNVLSGVPLDADGNMQVSLISLLNPFALLVGLTTVAMFAMHGAIFLTMKTDGDLLARIERILPRLIGAFFVLNTLVVIAMLLFRQEITARYTTNLWLVIFPAAALLALIAAWRLLRQGRTFLAFVASSATIALVLISGAIGLYPNLLISTTDPAYNMTATNAAAADNTLVVCLIVAVIGVPFILLYTAGVYYFFRGKTVVESDGY